MKSQKRNSQDIDKENNQNQRYFLLYKYLPQCILYGKDHMVH